MTDARAIVAANLAHVRERMAAAAASAGRNNPAEIRLVAICKYVGVSTAAALVAEGCLDLGESRPQELWEKSAAADLAGARWHLVGRLQRNKVRRTLPLVNLIHSVDSVRLIAAIDELAAALQLNSRILLEVNCAGESEKQGFSPDEVRTMLPALGRYPHLQVAGLMTMAPRTGGDAAARRSFAALRQLRDELSREAPPGVTLNELSMGMSGDFEAAIAEGSTLVRVGSSLFEGLI
jgi:pyridoxal phosphate enzyme (YggS family)